MSVYVVRRVTPRIVLQPLLSLAVLGTWWVYFDLPRLMLAVAAGALILSAWQLVRTFGTRLRVDSRGITLSAGQQREPAVHLPWVSVREVVVAQGPTARPRVGVRLHHGAPLPAGVRGLVHDPAQPDRVQPALVREVPGLDLGALEAAVQPHGVRLVTTAEI